ncbi:MAG: GtrA family protein [Kiritimatiellales bacterium]|nr:GtrA family protein [Kiritimatiellales bacterium]
MKIIAKLLQEKDHAGLQFIKYSLCGGVALAVDMLVFFLMAWLVFPALTDADPLVRIFGMDVQTITEGVRVRNFWFDSIVAFIFSNLTAYVLNVFFVFKSGKHGRHVELVLFYAVSLVSLLAGTFVGSLLITVFNVDTSYSYVAKAVSATLVNYAGRKFLIFHG